MSGRPTSARKRSRSLARVFGVTKRGGDAEDLEFGAAESEGDSEGVVNVVADVSVEDYFFRHGVGGGGLG